MSKKIKNNSGFSLVEMLVAVAIVGIAIPPLINAYVLSLQSSIAAERRAKAMTAAEWQLANYISQTDYDDISGDASYSEFTDEDGNFADFEYKLDVETLSGAYPEFEAKKLGICVKFDDVHGSGERTINHSNADDCDYDYIEIVAKTIID